MEKFYFCYARRNYWKKKKKKRMQIFGTFWDPTKLRFRSSNDRISMIYLYVLLENSSKN